MSDAPATSTSPMTRAQAFLATTLGGTWDDDLYLQVADNECRVEFDRQVDEQGTELYLTDIAVVRPGERLGGRIIDALRDFADAEGVLLLIGPCTNYEYWDCPDGIHPRRHPWLEEFGDEHGDPVFGYRPAARPAA